jgi:chemotaxis protein methyltransferase CheR
MHKLVVILVAGAIVGIVMGIFVGVSGGKKRDDKPVVATDEPSVAMTQTDGSGSAAPSISEAMTTTTTPPVKTVPTITQVNPPPPPPPTVVDPPVTPSEPTFKPIKPPPSKPAIAPKVQTPDEPVIKKPVKTPVVDEPEEEPVAKKSGSEADLYKKGADAYMAGDFKAAESAYKQALALNRGFAPAHRGLGFLYQRMGESAKALQSLRTYLKLTPNAKDGAAIRKRIQQLGGE